MGFTFQEFPDADYYRSDLRAVLRYVRSITDYLKSLDAIIEELREGLARLDAIEADVKSLDEWRQVVNEDLTNIHNEVLSIQSDVVELTDRLQFVDISIDNLNSRLVFVETSLGAVYQYIDDKVAEVLAKHTEDFNLLLLKLNQTKVLLQSEIAELREIINNIDTNVYNPWLGRKVSLEENERFTYNHLADECPTARDYMSLGITAGQYAGLEITSGDYQEFGRKRIGLKKVFSPVYGWRQEINVVLTSIINYLCNTLTANEYASLDLSADDYAALDLTSEEYFRYNPLVAGGNVSVDPNGTGLTAEQYGHLTIN